MKTKKYDLVGAIMQYESGELSDNDTLELFSQIIKRKLMYTLQGHYGRTASALIQDDFLTNNGEYTDKAKEFIENNS